MVKVQVKVYLDQALRDRFYDYVKTKYKSLHGGLSVEVQQAMAHWINEQGLNAHTKAHINPGMPRVQAKIDNIISWLRQQGYTNQFVVGDWEKACLNVVGSDQRTIKKYLQIARKLGRIKFYGGAVWEIV